VNEKPTDQEMTAAAEAIIDRVAALRPDHDYETNGLVWAVAGYAAGLQSIIDEERPERDRLRDDLAVERQNAKVLQGYFDQAIEKAITAEAERDRLRAVVEAACRTVGGSIQAIEAARTEDMGRDVILRNVSAALSKAYDQLDVSPTIGGQADE
jgi:hypothetical protein